MQTQIRLEPALHVRDSDGAIFVRFTPVLEPTAIAYGRITFATWDAELGDSKEQVKAIKDRAIESARAALRQLAAIN